MNVKVMNVMIVMNDECNKKTTIHKKGEMK